MTHKEKLMEWLAIHTPLNYTDIETLEIVADCLLKKQIEILENLLTRFALSKNTTISTGDVICRSHPAYNDLKRVVDELKSKLQEK